MKARIINATEKLDDPIGYPTRVVLLEIKKADRIEYSCHIEVFPPNAAPYLIWGDYDSPHKAYEGRVKRDGYQPDPGFEPETEYKNR